MRCHLVIFLLFILCFSRCSAKHERTQTTSPARPNVLFIFADDQTYTSIQALGNREIKTPNLDRLVSSGATFTHTYNMGAWSGAVCVASRAMMISGRSVWRAQKITEDWKSGGSLDKTWGNLLEHHGYNTYMTGKWHVDAPADKVFQEVKHVRPGMPADAWDHAEMEKKFEEVVDYNKVKPEDVMPTGYNRPLSEDDNSWSPVDTQFGGYWEGGKHWSEVLKDDAISFIEAAAQKDDPFFMYLAFNAPHDPRQSPQEFLDRYPLNQITLPPSWLPDYPYKDQIGNGPRLRDEALAPFPRTEYATKVHLKEYYALITHMDQQIGGILEALERSGKMDNTYIFFTADHGLAMGRHGFMGKQNMYEHTLGVPLIVVGPGIPEGKKIDQNIYLQDIMATTLELANVAKPDYIEFKSLLSTAKGESGGPLYDAIYGCYKDLQRMIKKDGFKLIVYPEVPKVRLYHLSEDPDEMNDLAEQPEYEDKVHELFQDLIKLQSEMGDELDLKPLFNDLFGHRVKL